MAEPVDAADAYAQQLRELWEAAGRPTSAAIVRQAEMQMPAVRVARSSWSDWKNGLSVPSDLVAARWLIEDYLRPLARRKTPGYVAPPARWWEQMRARAVAERPVGGRPPINHPPAAPVERPPLLQVGLIPPQADSFQTREIIDSLEQVTIEDGTVVLCQVLAGMGGVGKTQLAAAYTRQARDRVEVLVWVVASSRPAVIDAYAAAAVKLRLTDRDDPEQAAKAFLEQAATTARPWLIVLDDVHEQRDLHGLWPPATPAGTTIVTTRRRDLSPPGLRPRTIEVGTFTSEQACSYLKDRIGDLADNHDELKALVEDLGRLPLALAQAAAFMIQQDIDCARYRGLLRERLLANAMPEETDLPDDHRRVVSGIWELSIDQADRARPPGTARSLLDLISVLDPNGIPASVLTSQPALDHLTTHTERTDGSTSNSPSAVTTEMVDEALRVLHRYSLITHDRSATHHEVRVHQLVQRATREHLRTNNRGDLGTERLAALAETASNALLAVWPELDHDDLGQTLRANAVALHASAGAALWNNRAHHVLFYAANSLGAAGQTAAASTEYQHLHALSLRLFGPDHPDTLTTCGNFARWRGEAGDVVGAATAFEELLRDFLRVLGPDHPDTLTTRAQLAYWRGRTGDAAGAATAFEELLTDVLRILGPDHPDTLTTRNSLAAWRKRAGDAVGAAAFEAVQTDQLRILGPDHRHTLSTRGHLISLRGEAGDAAGAATAYADLLADRLRTLGPDHPDTLTTRAQLAYWRSLAGDFTGAVTALEELLPDQLRVLGPDHPDTLTTRNNLAAWRGEAGDAAGAATAFEELLPDRLRVLGPDHPDTLKTRSNLAAWRSRAGDVLGAAIVFKDLLADQLRVLGPDHLDTLITRNNLASLRGQVGDTAGATAAFEELLADQLPVLGPDHPLIHTLRKNLALWHSSRQK